MNEILKTFKKFDPLANDNTAISDCPGNYVIALREDAVLPGDMQPDYIPCCTLEGVAYRVIYTGISSKSLRKRDYRQHFTGNNAGQFTLRKSLGSLMGLSKIPRNAGDPENGKTKFNDDDEAQLSLWMAANLLLFFKTSTQHENPKVLERELIEKINPPLNIKDNPNDVNNGYRRYLSDLRRHK